MKKIVLLLLVVIFTDGSAYAQSKVGTTIGAFLRIEPTARAAGMGNAGSALPGGIEAVYFNPGVHDKSYKLKAWDLKKLCKPTMI